MLLLWVIVTLMKSRAPRLMLSSGTMECKHTYQERVNNMSSEEFKSAASPYTKLLAEQRLTSDLLSKGIDKDGVAFSEKIYIIEKCRKFNDERSRKNNSLISAVTSAVSITISLAALYVSIRGVPSFLIQFMAAG